MQLGTAIYHSSFLEPYINHCQLSPPYSKNLKTGFLFPSELKSSSERVQQWSCVLLWKPSPVSCFHHIHECREIFVELHWRDRKPGNGCFGVRVPTWSDTHSFKASHLTQSTIQTRKEKEKTTFVIDYLRFSSNSNGFWAFLAFFPHLSEADNKRVHETWNSGNWKRK